MRRARRVSALTPERADASARRPMGLRGRTLLFFASLAAMSGCIVDGKLDANGGAHLKLRCRLVSVANFEQSKVRLQSPDVKLTDASMTPDKWATFDVETTDVRKLPTASAFAPMKFALTDEADGARTFTLTIDGNAAELPPPYVKYLGNDLRVALELPGDVVRSNATTVAGRTVSWVVPLAGKHESPTVFTVTFAPPAGAAKPRG